MMQQLPTFTFISLRVICLPEKLNFKTAQSTLVGIMQSRKYQIFTTGFAEICSCPSMRQFNQLPLVRRRPVQKIYLFFISFSQSFCKEF